MSVASASAEHSDDRRSQVALAILVEPGQRELGRMIRADGPTASLERILSGAVSPGLAGTIAARLATRGLPKRLRSAWDLAEQAEQDAHRLGARILLPGDEQWPDRLADLARISSHGQGVDVNTDPPLCLWVRGNARLAALAARSVALVGSRAVTDYGAACATDLAYELSDRGWTVVSGGALGADAAAHRGALAGASPTVAVLACGIDRPYPVANTSLFEQVVEAGAIISEWPPGAAPHRQRFLTRNRVIAALTLGTVIVEAAARSGARHTLGRARLLGRPVMAVPGPITSAMSVGCHIELRTVDTRVVTSAEEIIEEVGAIGELAPMLRGPMRPHDGLDSLAARILDAVPPGRPQAAEEIAATAGVSGVEARRSLPRLLAAGLVIRAGDGYRLTMPDGGRGSGVVA